jgi:signal transduction histidine kinase
MIEDGETHGAQLLLLEDDASIRFPISRFFRERGISVVEATSCQEARAVIETHSPEVAVIDLSLPDGDGLDLLPDLVGRDLPIATIVLTGNATIARAVRAIKLGADQFLTKPVELAGLYQMVERLMTSAHDRRIHRGVKRSARRTELDQSEGESQATDSVQLRVQLELRRLRDEMGTFIAGVAHEVRNPLFAITANLQALQEETDKAAVFDEYFSWIQSSAIRLQVLMQDLLDYARPVSNQLVRGRLHEVIERSVAACSGSAGRAGVELRIDGTTDPEILMDPQRIEQVFTNLIENAIALSPARSMVRISAYHDATHGVVCVIEDSGPGFSPEEIERGFEPFFTRRKGGTGLGLAVVRRIMDSHGGTVDLGNRVCGGARVRLVFPLPVPQLLVDAAG